MTIQQLEKSWQSGKPDAIYFFYGEEEFLRSELLTKALDAFIPDFSLRSFNYDQLSGTTHKIADVINCAKNYPVMSDLRVVICTEAEKMLTPRGAEKVTPKDESRFDVLYDYLEDPNRNTILIFSAEKSGTKTHYPWKSIFAKVTTLEFTPLKEAAATEWIVTRAKKAGRNFETKAANALVSHIGSDLRALLSELEKLMIYTGDREKITVADVEMTTGISPLYNIFALQNAIGTGNKAKAVEIGLRMLEIDKSARYPIFFSLAKYFEQLEVTREMASRGQGENAIAQALGLFGGGAYFVKDYISAARRYPKAKLDHAMRTIVDAEFDTRRFKIDDAMLIEKLLTEIIA
ncbi:MAG: DNA polymerase III subunit delta [bacterium]